LEVIEKSAGGAKGCLDAENLTRPFGEVSAVFTLFFKQMDLRRSIGLGKRNGLNSDREKNS
jgi:hypothetical protein